MVVSGGRVFVADNARCGEVAGRLLRGTSLRSRVKSEGGGVKVGPGLISPSRTS